ncbi:hypothetical protein Lal_00046384 [Lupinus albus]|nr:hypothetical protein Lal_00046384 [Lupinus albus]
MVSHLLRRDPSYPKQVSKGRRELESRVLPLLKLLDDSQDSLLLKMLPSITSLYRQILTQASSFSLKRENPSHFKNSDLTLSLKQGCYSLYSFRVPLLAQARQLSLRRANSRSSEPILAQARILQYSIGFHSPRVSQESLANVQMMGDKSKFSMLTARYKGYVTYRDNNKRKTIGVG